MKSPKHPFEECISSTHQGVQNSRMKETLRSFVSFVVLNFVCLDVVSGVRLYEKNNTDVYLNSLQLIRKYGYPAESHIVRTQDGYLLELHRIPQKKNQQSPSRGPPVFLQHGLLGSSADFLLIGPGKALPYLLADRGYDVWLGNMRGSTYSRAHETLTPEDKKFWDFSWHESGLYDISAQIDFICNYTQEKDIIYVGYSMGTTEFLVLTSMRPEYQKKIRGAVFLAAVAYLNNTKTPIRVISPLTNDFQLLADLLADGEFLQQGTLYRYLVRYACTLNSIERRLCSNILFLYSGCDPFQFNQDILQSIAFHLPAGSSAKCITHFGQLVNSGDFCQFDYGPVQNMIKYNSVQPPRYNLEGIHVPIYLFEGANDFLSTLEDSSRLVKRLPNVKNYTVVDFPTFNHMDFVFATDVKTLLYDSVLEAINNLADEGQIGTQDDYDENDK